MTAAWLTMSVDGGKSGLALERIGGTRDGDGGLFGSCVTINTVSRLGSLTEECIRELMPGEAFQIGQIFLAAHRSLYPVACEATRNAVF